MMRLKKIAKFHEQECIKNIRLFLRWKIDEGWNYESSSGNTDFYKHHISKEVFDEEELLNEFQLYQNSKENEIPTTTP